MKRVQSFILSMVLLLSCLYIPVDVMAEEEQGESSAQEQTAEEGTEKTAEQEQAEAEDAEQMQPAVVSDWPMRSRLLNMRRPWVALRYF